MSAPVNNRITPYAPEWLEFLVQQSIASEEQVAEARSRMLELLHHDAAKKTRRKQRKDPPADPP